MDKNFVRQNFSYQPTISKLNSLFLSYWLNRSMRKGSGLVTNRLPVRIQLEEANFFVENEPTYTLENRYLIDYFL